MTIATWPSVAAVFGDTFVMTGLLQEEPHEGEVHVQLPLPRKPWLQTPAVAPLQGFVLPPGHAVHRKPVVAFA